jgi:hypothetical protein
MHIEEFRFTVRTFIFCTEIRLSHVGDPSLCEQQRSRRDLDLSVSCTVFRAERRRAASATSTETEKDPAFGRVLPTQFCC